MKFGYFILLLCFGFIAEVVCNSCSSVNEFSCLDKKRCIGKAFVCDEFPNCLDESDEDETLCEGWSYEYEYEDEDTGGGFAWGGPTEEEKEEETKKESKVESKHGDHGGYASFGQTQNERQMCSLNKCKAKGPLSFRDGREYRYTYELLTKTEAVRAADNQTSSSLVTCDVTLQVLTACEMYLKVGNIVSKSSSADSKGQATHTDENTEFLRSIENQQLRFSMLGGEVDFICPLMDEDKRALNFKRGILSLLQNTMPKLHIPHSQVEKDVVGECEMNYKFEGSNGPRTVVSKTQDLPSCKSRSHITSMAQGVPYNFPLTSNPLQLVESERKCTQEIKSGLIVDASCQESHDLTPFRADEGRITTSIDQKLSLVSEGLFLSKWSPIEHRTDILFEHDIPNVGSNSEVHLALANSLLDNMEQIIDASYSENRSPSSDFKLLVTALRQLSLDQLLNFNKAREWKESDRQLFLDAISMVGTASSISFMAAEMPNLAADKKSVVISWVNSLRHIQSPSRETMTAVADFLELDNIPHEIYLSLGSLLNTYCLSHPACQTHEPVISIMDAFKQVLKSGCLTKTPNEKIKILYALRGIGNAGLASNSLLVDALNKCIAEEKNEPEVTATAIDAFRRIPCNVSRSALEAILQDESKDSEMRILSYLGLMKCANYETLHLIENLFQKEEVNQVGSFIWTHLTNLQESSVPSKIDAQSLLSNRVFEEKFKSDFRKYSKNIEMSGFYDPLNIGGSLESNIIFSEKSYIPRQTSLNLTADLFGRSYNLFEIGTRFEGFEKYVEQLIFGGHSSSNTKEIKSKSIKSLLKQTDRKKEYLQAEPHISVNLKTFGNDFAYQHLDGMEDFSALLNTFNLQSIVKSLKEGRKFSLKKSYLPLDSTFEVATSGGFPLKFNIEGSASVDSSIEFQLDVTGLMLGKAKLKGHFNPNLSVNLRTSMMVDGFSSSNGVEMDSSFHSSVMIDGVAEIDGKNAVSVDFNLPQAKIDIFKVSSRLAIVHGYSKPGEEHKGDNREEVTNPFVPSSAKSNCLLIDYAFGIKLCYYKQHPLVEKSPLNHRILLNGPIKYNLELVKKAPTLSSYKFRYRWNNDDRNLLFYILYDTPGSEPPGMHSLKIELNYENSEALFNFNTPKTSLDAKGRYTWTPDVKRLNATLNINDQGEAQIDAGYKVHERSEQRIVIPIFEVNWKNNQIVTLKGNLETRERPQTTDIVHYGVDLQFVVNTEPTGPGGQRVEGVIKGILNKDNNDWELSWDVSYIFPGSRAWENTNIYYRRVMQVSDHLVKMIRTWKVSFSQFKHLNTKGTWASKTFAGSAENSIKASFGSDYENPLNQVDLFQSFIYGVYEPIVNATIAIKYPKKQLDVKIGADLYHDSRDFNSGFIFQYASGKAIKSRVHIIQSNSGPMHVEGSYSFFLPSWLDVSAKGEIKQTELDTYEIDFEGSVNSQRLELFGYYTNLSTRLKQLHKLEMKIKLPSRDVIYSNSTFLYDATQFAAAVQIKTKDGSKYKVRIAYISQLDDYKAHQRKIEVDLFLPQRSYYWHSEITFGKYITISNDIHFDSYRDINLWLQIYRHQDEPTEVNMKLFWDANRDPHKKANLQVTIGDKSAVLVSSIVFFGNEYKFTWRSNKDLVIEDNRLATWSHQHAGEFSWNDDKREIHRVMFGGNFNLVRKDGARLTADAYLRTPIQTWKDNTIRIEYSRSAEQIIASLNSKWHKDEFLNLNFNSGLTKVENGLKLESKVEVLSFINDNMVTFSSGANIIKTNKNLDGTVFIKWDKDEVKFLIELKNKSNDKDIVMSALGKILTTLKGYKHLSTSVDLLATSGSLSLYGSTEWEDVLYSFKCNGVLYSAMEYLKGEIYITTPQYGPDTASATIRVFHDSQTHDEKLMINGHWLNKEIKLNGRVLAQPQDFRAELNAALPFPKLSQASMSLGHSTKDFYMSEVWFKWNNTKDLGLKIDGRLDSLTDFLMSLAIKTPFTKYKELKGELRNLFELSPSVNLDSMVYGQLDSRKYGLGAIYKQGESPKLRVGLELYYPSPGLEEVKFDISDNSTETNMRYNFELKHGEDKQIDINTDFKKSTESVEFYIASGITLSSILGPGFEKVNFEGETKIHWNKPLGIQLRLASMTPHNTNKIFFKGSFGDVNGLIEGNLALPFEHLEDFEYFLRYQYPEYNRMGLLNVKVSAGRIPLITLDCEEDKARGTASLKFTSPVENYKRGHLEYKLIPQDIEKSKVLGSCSIENKEILFEGFVYLYEDHNVKFEIDATTPFKGYESARLTLISSENSNDGIRDKLTFTVGDTSYEGEIFRVFYSEPEWIFRAKIINIKKEMKPYTLAISYKADSGDPILLSFKAESPIKAYELFSALIKIQSVSRPYDLTLEWDIPISSGKLDLVLESFSNEKIFGSASLSLDGPETSYQSYTMKLKLTNLSTKDNVDLGLYTEIISTLKEYDHIIVDGTLKQVTSEPGLLQVYLVWPQLDPVNFTATASYSGLPSFDLRASANLNITTATYGLIGEVQREGKKLDLKTGLFWQKGEDFSVKRITFVSSFEIGVDSLNGYSELRLPMVKGFEVNKADINYKKEKNLRILSVALEAGKTRTSIESALNSNNFPAAEGNITLASSEFREGNPLILTFKQALTSDGYKGEYEFEWPVWDLKTRSYGREFVRAILHHSYLPKGQEGVLQLLSPLTKGKPISLTYSFVFPKRPDLTIKFGIGYENIKFEIKVSHEVAISKSKQIKKSSVEFDNLIWPFGIAYLETISLHNELDIESHDFLMIYDLQDTERRSSLNFIRKSTDEEGSKFSIKGILVEREIEFSVGHKTSPDAISGDVLLSWSPEERIQCDFDWRVKSSSTSEKSHIIKARMSHPLRTLLLETIYIIGDSKLSLDLTLNPNLNDPGVMPLKIVGNYENKKMKQSEKQIIGSFKISHPTLQNDINFSAEFQRKYLYPLLLNVLLEYSPSSENDLSIMAHIKRNDKENSFEDVIEITHIGSNLHAKANGKIKYGSSIYSFDQSFAYTKADGEKLMASLDGGIDLDDKSLHTQVESSERLLDLKLKISEKEKGHWELLTSSETHENLPLATYLQLHPSQPIFVLTIESLKPENSSNQMTFVEDPEYPRYLAKKVVIEGGLEDQRFAHLSMKHLSPSLKTKRNDTKSWTQDLDFAFRLNNSRLISSYIDWRKRIEDEVKNEIHEFMGMTHEIRADVKEWIKTAVVVTGKEAIGRAKPILKDVVATVKPLLNHFKNESKDMKNDFYLLFKNINMTKKEQNLKESIHFALSNIAASLSQLKIVEKLKERLAQGTLKIQILNYIQKIKEFYGSLLDKDPSLGKLIAKVKEFASSFASAYDNAVKKWYLTFRNSVDDFKMRLSDWLRTKWHNLYSNYKPHILRTLHHVEAASYTIVSQVWDSMNRLGANFKSLSYVQMLEQIYGKLKHIYTEMAKKSLRQNLEWVYQYAVTYIKRGIDAFFARILPFIDDWLDELKSAWEKFTSYDSIRSLVEFCSTVGRTITWTLQQIDFSDYFLDAVAFSIEHGYTIMTQKAVDAQLRNMNAKTDLTWTPAKGEIKFVQKLPFDWNRFDESPSYKEMFEIPYVAPLKQIFFSSAKFSLLDGWYRYFNLNFKPLSWIPPFTAVGYVVGEDHILTFDGKLIKFKGSCEHLLTADLIHHNWAASVKFNKHTPKTINVYIEGKVIEFSKQLKVKINDRLATVPLSLDTAYIWRSHGSIHLQQENGIQLSWNLVHDVVSIKVPRVSFLNTIGLLGTNNNEPTDDLLMPGGKRWKNNTDIKDYVDAWKLDDVACQSEQEMTSLEEPVSSSTCEDLFISKSSPFKYCFHHVDPEPYYEMCLDSYKGNIKDTRASALAFRERCTENAVPIKLPAEYVKCEYTNVTSNSIKKLQEGQTVIINKRDLENAVDVVVLVELRECNKKKLRTKNFHNFITTFNDGLIKEGVQSTRFALVSYGGKGYNERPSIVSSDNEIFTTSKNIANYLENLDFVSDNESPNPYSENAFSAILYALNYVSFRSPVNVIFALFPCTPCQDIDTFDYPTMYHSILDNSASLYVFKDGYFDIQKESMRKKIIGYDNDVAYTIKDQKKQKMGDSALKNQIIPPKMELDMCLPLALETNGMVLTSEFLMEPKKKVERLGLIAGRRAGKNCKTDSDQRCLCLSTQEVTPDMRCDKWDQGDFSVLERYGLILEPDSSILSNIENDKRKGFYD